MLLLVVVASGNHKTNNFVNNINGVRSIEAIHIVSKYDNRNNQLEVIPVSNMSEAVQYGTTNPISFVGDRFVRNSLSDGGLFADSAGRVGQRTVAFASGTGEDFF